PHGGGQFWRLGAASLEAVGVRGEGGVKRDAALLSQPSGRPEVHRLRGHQRDARVTVDAVVPLEEAPAMGPRILDGPEALRKVMPVFQSFELGLRVRIV